MTELARYYDPLTSMSDMRRRIDNMFGELAGAQRGLHMDVDVQESEKEIVVTADLPGVQRDDIDIRANSGHLEISAKRESRREETERGYHRAERSFGSITRAIPLPDVDTEHIQARLQDGVLEIRIPKSQQASTKIEVKE